MEVLLVLVILVVLGSMAMMAYGPMQERAKVDQARSQIGLFKSPLELYRLHVGEFPTTAEGLGALISDSGQPGWSGPYIDPPIPTIPWNMPYQYEYPGRYNPDKPDIFSMGRDRTAIRRMISELDAIEQRTNIIPAAR